MRFSLSISYSDSGLLLLCSRRESVYEVKFCWVLLNMIKSFLIILKEGGLGELGVVLGGCLVENEGDEAFDIIAETCAAFAWAICFCDCSNMSCALCSSFSSFDSLKLLSRCGFIWCSFDSLKVLYRCGFICCSFEIMKLFSRFGYIICVIALLRT